MDLTKKDLERMLGLGNVVIKKTVEKMAQECIEWRALAEARIYIKKRSTGWHADYPCSTENVRRRLRSVDWRKRGCPWPTMHAARRAVYGALTED